MKLKEGVWNQCLRYVAASDVGLRRANNQDAFNIMLAGSAEQFAAQGHVFVVADGMGAHAAGELASKIATDVIPLNYFKAKDELPAQALTAAVQDAHRQIHEKGQADEAFHGMGTTVDTVVVMPEGLLVAHVGDSRVYRLRGETFEQLTFDHSLVWELRAAGKFPDGQVPSYVPRNIITRSLGPNEDVKVDLEGPFPVEPGDTFLLCSDGLSGPVQDAEMGQILTALQPEQAVRTLVNLANLRGGPDNITVTVLRVEGELGEQALRTGAGRPMASTVCWLSSGICLLAAILLTALGLSPPALVAGAAGAVLAVIALVIQVSAADSQSALPDAPLGNGPYTSVSARPEAGFTGNLLLILSELRDVATEGKWDVQWDDFHRLMKQADAAVSAGDHSGAIRASATAIGHVIDELKRQNS